jgi:predicted component of type VI protein secretion system
MSASTVRPESAPRYRLRFLLQEFHLPFGITLIGRGEDCQITLFDASVSRQHARIIVDDRCAIIDDMRSRNGSRVNGRRINGPTTLREGDRIRIGTQELVFGIAYETSHVQKRNTGSICFCESCKSAYAQEMNACPHCGSTAMSGEWEEEDASHCRRRKRSSPPSR